jgi:hypothetical protein
MFPFLKLIIELSPTPGKCQQIFLESTQKYIMGGLKDFLELYLRPRGNNESF